MRINNELFGGIEEVELGTAFVNFLNNRMMPEIMNILSDGDWHALCLRVKDIIFNLIRSPLIIWVRELDVERRRGLYECLHGKNSVTMNICREALQLCRVDWQFVYTLQFYHYGRFPALSGACVCLFDC